MKNTKHIYTTLWLLLSSMMLSAAEICEQQALEHARQFMLQVTNNSQTASRRAMQHVSMRAAQTGIPELYAFNIEGGGYVIASADDRTLPVLGYSLTGSFDASRIPDNMRAWLQGYAEQIRQLGDAVVTSTTDSDPDMTAIEPLIKTRWGQDEPYNLQTPITDGVHAVTGCVATAMAQVMYYHQWPQAATTAIPAYSYLLSIIESFPVKGLPATTFKWDKMLPAYTKENPGTEEQRQAIAELMRYCGQSVSMKYGVSFSGSYTEEIADALRYYFGYSKTVHSVEREGYTLESWKKLIWDELNQKRPVCMGASSSDGGHAFVIDGYDGNGMFHVNWGWEGDCDNYYAIDVMNPEPDKLPIGYNSKQSVVIGAKPRTANEETLPEVTSGLQLRGFPYVSSKCLKAPVFCVDMTCEEIKYDIALGTKNTDGTISLKQTLKEYIEDFSGAADVVSFELEKLTLPDGTYQLYAFYRKSDDAGDTWHQLGTDRDYWGIHVKDSKMSFFFDVKLKITKAYLEGDNQAPLDQCTLVVEVENQDDMMFCAQTLLKAGRMGENNFVMTNNYDKSKTFLILQPKEKTTLRYPLIVPSKGDMDVRLCVHEGDEGLANAVVPIDKEPHYYDIQLTDYKVEYKAGETDLTKAFTCILYLKNNDKRQFNFPIISRVGTDNSVYDDFTFYHYHDMNLEPGEEVDGTPDLSYDLENIKEPTDLHLVISIDYKYPLFPLVKLLDIVVKPGTTVTPKGTTAIKTIPISKHDDAPYYDLQGRRLQGQPPRKGVYIQKGKKVMVE